MKSGDEVMTNPTSGNEGEGVFCQIGSCQRHNRCMYHPCRSMQAAPVLHDLLAETAVELADRVRKVISEWDIAESRDDWWQYQRDYATMFESLATAPNLAAENARQANTIMEMAFEARAKDAEIATLRTQLAERDETIAGMAWVYPKSIEDMPAKPGKETYEYVECLVLHKGELLTRPWNCEHQVFDDDAQDDWFCNWDDITAYIDLTVSRQALTPQVPHG